MDIEAHCENLYRQYSLLRNPHQTEEEIGEKFNIRMELLGYLGSNNRELIRKYWGKMNESDKSPRLTLTTLVDTEEAA